jgi:outer membrane lipoprotein-sorting protein
MKKHIITLGIMLFCMVLFAQKPNAADIIREMSKNLVTENTKATTKMVVHSRRSSRTLEMLSYSSGKDKSFSEYLSPPREKGTKMLKLDNQLWIYDPTSDRTIQISGNMLKQSVMGSDLSYEDMTEDTDYAKDYDAEILEESKYDGREVWILKLNAKRNDVSYQMRKTYVDKERYIPLYEEWYAKNGKLLKTYKVSEVKKISGRWQPTKILFKDELKAGKGTEYIVVKMEIGINIPEYIFSRASLRK